MSSVEFGELRSLVYRTPSVALFHQLLDLVETFDEAQRTQWIPYLDQQLDRWPDRLRCCPQPRLKELEQTPLIWSPLLRHLNYEGEHLTPKRFELILQNTHLQHITFLNLSACRFKWPDLLQLVDAAPFTQLKGFAMRKSSSSGADRDAIETLFASPMLSQLESLSFDGWSGIKSFVLGLVANAPFLKTLKSLNLSGCKVSAKRLQAILHQPDIAGLESFHMGYQGPSASKGRMTVIAKATHLTNLHTLDIADFQPDELIVLSQAEHMKSLRHLRLAIVDSLSRDDPNMDDEAIVTFCQSPHLAGLESLELDMNLLKNSTIREVMCAPFMTSLRELKIISRAYTNWSLIRPTGDAYKHYYSGLLSSERMGHLQSIRLTNLNPDLDEFHAFVHSPLVQNLNALYISDTEMSIAHIEMLSQSEQFKSLKSLMIGKGSLSLDMMQSIVFSGRFPCLEHIEMWHIRSSETFHKDSLERLLKHPDFPERLTITIRFW